MLDVEVGMTAGAEVRDGKQAWRQLRTDHAYVADWRAHSAAPVVEAAPFPFRLRGPCINGSGCTKRLREAASEQIVLGEEDKDVASVLMILAMNGFEHGGPNFGTRRRGSWTG